MSVCALDVGTNTLRVLIKDNATNAIIEKKNYYLFLGNEVKEGTISEHGKALLISTLSEIYKLIKKHEVTYTIAVATAFARKLSNINEIKQVFKDALDLDLKIIDAQKEGEIVLAAIQEFYPVADCMVIDLGGGSTEFVIKKNSKTSVISLDFGSLSLTGRMFPVYPPDQNMIQQLILFVRDVIAERCSDDIPRCVFGVGGTVTSVVYILSACKYYDPRIINGFQITPNALSELYERVKTLPHHELRSMFRLENGREKVLLAGCLILLTIMSVLNISVITASDYSLLDGIMLTARKRSFSR